ncbi:hypothetical protein C4K35_4191 [Pseudomonas chlororaphis subsp. piscium]|uniref:hypothetical protein n=1 Tax=Pseudomonas chlororaphis TaxID=587753 RepID=UPI000F6D6EEF|nr:hypothetical protein [Pseudomonas chlororaphis]AZC51766.1 hypothetical protein C4K35_4191 [Pseudomonas chlororaphis subsp. piscium]
MSQVIEDDETSKANEDIREDAFMQPELFKLANHWALIMKEDVVTGRFYAAGFNLSR